MDTTAAGGGTETTSNVEAPPRTVPKTVDPPAAPAATTIAAPAVPRTTTSSATTGPLVDAINGIGPKKADSFPLPLIVLAAIALLLVAAGAAGFLVRRRQTRGLS